MARESSSSSSEVRATAAAATQRVFRWSFFVEVYSELRKVEWPTREQVVRLTIVAIVLTAMVGVLLGAADLLLNYILDDLVVNP
ncbi:MAG: preprotein translocase subunit SecE [Dehalococcoidia bacterium]|nr:preprotein translocase subunit SecE [Dehalococcoidia bacterium]